MNKTINTLSISSILLALSACGSDNRSTDDSLASSSSMYSNSSLASTSSSSLPSGDIDSSANNSSTPNNANNISTALDGVWFKDCFAEDSSDPDTFYDTVEVTFNNGNVATNIHIYTDSDCTNPMPLAPNPTAQGTFSIGASFTSGDGITVQELDVHLTESNGAPFDEYSYNIFYIDGDQLFTGEEDAETPNGRPTMLDFTSAFIKQ